MFDVRNNGSDGNPNDNVYENTEGYWDPDESDSAKYRQYKTRQTKTIVALMMSSSKHSYCYSSLVVLGRTMRYAGTVTFATKSWVPFLC